MQFFVNKLSISLTISSILSYKPKNLSIAINSSWLNLSSYMLLYLDNSLTVIFNFFNLDKPIFTWYLESPSKSISYPLVNSYGPPSLFFVDDFTSSTGDWVVVIFLKYILIIY